MVAALSRLRATKDMRKMATDLADAYPESPELQFLAPDPLADVEAHLKAGKHFGTLKAEGFLYKLAENQALVARPLVDAMSYVAEAQGPLDVAVVAERLSDIAKGLIIGSRQAEAARIDLVCAAFKVPVSAAQPEAGVSLLGSKFASGVDRLRKDKKVLTGEGIAATGYQQRQSNRSQNRAQDGAGPRRTQWKRRHDGSPAWNNQNMAPNQQGSASAQAQRNSGGNNAAHNPQGTNFHSISDAVHKWVSLTSDEWILRAVAGYKIRFLSPPMRRRPPPPIPFSTADSILVDDLIHELLHKKAIRPISQEQVLFISNLFLVAKKGTEKRRPVINLKRLNEFIPDEKFKMEGWAEVKEAVFPRCFFARIDLKDAYLSVPMSEHSQPYLAFRWREQIYCWTRLPFGLKSSPRVFTKLLKPVVAKLRQEGIHLIVYLDDFLLIAESAAQVERQAQRACQLLEDLGYTVNAEKSCLTATQQVTFLGYVIDSVAMQLSVPQDKQQQIKSSVQHLLLADVVTLRALLRVLGQLNALTTIVRSVRYHCTPITEQVSLAARRTRDLDANIHLPEHTRDVLRWWLTHLEHVATGPVTPPIVSQEITTDSSLKGWGAWSGLRSTGGTWNRQDGELHINVLELKAIYLAVQTLAEGVTNTTLAIRTDNTTAMHCVNNFGSLRSPTINALARQLWAWALERNVFLKATYIPGVQNAVADALSRAVADDHSFSLNPAVFSRVMAEHGCFHVDLFADFSNYKIPTYVSWQKDPFAYAIDAFSVRWDAWPNLYAFPPFKLVDRCISYLDGFPDCELTLICPLWPTQAYFSRLLQRSIGYPMLLPTFTELLKDRSGESHPLLVSRRLQLVAWRLAPLACLNKRRSFWKTLLEHPPGAPTRVAGEAGTVGADGDLSLPLLRL